MADGYDKQLEDKHVSALKLPDLRPGKLATFGKIDFDDPKDLSQFIKDNPKLVASIEAQLQKQGFKFDATDPSRLNTMIRTVLVTAQHMQEESKMKPCSMDQALAAGKHDAQPAPAAQTTGIAQAVQAGAQAANGGYINRVNAHIAAQTEGKPSSGMKI